MKALVCLVIVELLTGCFPAAWCAQIASSDSVSAKLRTQLLKVKGRQNQDELFETESDYLFALKEERAPSDAQLRALLELAKFKPDQDQAPSLFVQLPLWLEALKDFRVQDWQSMTLLSGVMQVNAECNVSTLPAAQSETVWRLGQEVNALKASNPEQRKCQSETLWILASLLREDRQYGRSLGAMAIERLANSPEASSAMKRDAILRTFYAYSFERPSGTAPF